MSDPYTQDILELAQDYCETVANPIPGETKNLFGENFRVKPGVIIDSAKSQNCIGATFEESAVDPFVETQVYTSTDIISNFSFVTNNTECGYVMFMQSLLFETVGDPDMIYSLIAGAAPTLTCEHEPKKTDRN